MIRKIFVLTDPENIYILKIIYSEKYIFQYINGFPKQNTINKIACFDWLDWNTVKHCKYKTEKYSKQWTKKNTDNSSK